MRRIIILAFAAALVASGCASSQGGGGGGGAQGAKNGGFLRIGTAGQIDSLNPLVTFNSDPLTIIEYEYPYLLQFDTPGSNFAPYFATSWSNSPDGKTWTFHTVPNAKWSDGQPLTAKDAAWTINMILKYQKGPAGNLASYLTHATGAQATDDNTLVVTYDQPVANVLFQLQAVPILPEHIWGKFAVGDGKGLKQYSDTPSPGHPVVGGGPFVLTEYRPNQVAKMSVNPNWFGQKPHITGWGLEYFATEDAMVRALQTDQIDVIWVGVPTTAVQTLRNSGMHVSISPAITFHEMNFNSNPKKTTNPELQDPRVRDALSHAINYNAISNTAWNGFAQPGYSLIAPATGDAPGTNIPWTDPSLKPPTFDIALANKMLDDLGYKMGPNGYRIANGHPMQYTAVIPHNELGSAMRGFQIVQQGFKQVGVGLTPKVLNDSAAWAAETANHYTSYDISFWDWGCSPDPDCIMSVLICSAWYSWSDTAYCNKNFDKLYAAQGTAVDVKQRIKDIYAMQNIIYNDKPFIVLNYEDNRVAWNPKWTGFVPSSQGEFNTLSTQSLLNAHMVG